ncbi:MAG: VWA domain-containing protein [Candidatus Limnocylindrales bacterium]
MTFRARSDRRLIRSTHRSSRFVLAELVAPPARDTQGRPPVNLAFVLDRSGSMSGEKLKLAMQAVEMSIALLHDTDRFAVVVYDEQIDVVVANTRATAEARRIAVDRLHEIEARGSTNLSEGWLRGCGQIADALAVEGVNRCLLLTDGLANAGITDRDELSRHAGELRARGISTTTFGVGNDFDEVLLQAMARTGGGHFYYIANANSIADLISSEVGETLEVVARDVVVEVTSPEGVRIEALSPYPTRERRGATEIVVGDLTAEQEVSIVLRLGFGFGEIGDSTGAVVRVLDRDDRLDFRAVKLAWEYASNDANDAQPRDLDVDRAVARTFAARARQEAVARNRAGDYVGAQQVLVGTANRVRAYAGKDPELGAVISDLERDDPQFSAPMAPAMLKMAFAASAYQLNSRAVDGKARKQPPRDSV